MNQSKDKDPKNLRRDLVKLIEKIEETEERFPIKNKIRNNCVKILF